MSEETVNATETVTETDADGVVYTVTRTKAITTTTYSNGDVVVTENVISEERTSVTEQKDEAQVLNGASAASGQDAIVPQAVETNAKQTEGAGKTENVQQVTQPQTQPTQQISEQAASNAAAKAPNATIAARTHVQNDGWQSWRQATATANKSGTVTVGTSGRALRLEGLQVQLKGINGSVFYQVHVQNIGWQAVQANGSVAGTSGQSLRLEAVRIELAGEASQWYDIQYRAHVQNIGWQDWKSNGAMAGTSGRALRLEALEIRLVPKKQKASSGGDGIIDMRGQAHVQNIGNQAWVIGGSILGTTGKSLRMEAIRLQIDKGIYSGSIEYRTHVQNVGWTGWSKNGQLSGTTGRGLRMEAVEIRLTGNIAKSYEVVYRAHVQNIGWQDWVSGNNVAGTTGRSLRVEALEIQIIPRPSVPVPQRTISDGIYVMKVQASQGNAIGTAGASNASGANVQLVSDARWRLDEKWKITWKGNGYELQNINSGKVLDAVNGNKNMVANVQQANRNNSKNQRWAIQRNGSGYTIAGMNFGSVLEVQGGKLSSGSNIHLWSPTGGNAQRFTVTGTEAFYEGTYQVFTKLDQSGKCIDDPNSSVANGTRMTIAGANDGPNQHLTFIKKGNGYAIQVVASGKYLTASGSNVVQSSGGSAASQVWNPVVSNAGGLVFVNSATGGALSVQGNRNASGTGLQQVGRNDSAGQRWYPVARSLVSNGLYELRTSSSSGIVLDVNGASISNGANLTVHSRNGGNNQKFTIIDAGGGYYRISMPLAATTATVQGASKSNNANVRMETRNNSAAQLWRPVVTDGGLMFVNKGSGKVLACDSVKSDSNVRQTNQTGAAQQKWSVVRTSLNAGDLTSYRKVMGAVSGSGHLLLNNAGSDYSISKARWNQLVGALNDCWSEGYDLGFVMVDCSTGMSVSLNAYDDYFGASTIKGLYVTYLFQEYLEKGRLSWGDISDLAWDTIVWSDNDAYRALRGRYGSESGFGSWLNSVGMGYVDTWGTYDASDLASAWLHMLEYSESGGRYVGTWKSLFNHSDHSVIHEKLGGYRTTYSKPGWMEWGTWSGPITNDAGLVDDRNGRKYILAIMSDVDPDSDRYLLRNVVAALDAIHMEMPGLR